jgi:hypothetical protein
VRYVHRTQEGASGRSYLPTTYVGCRKAGVNYPPTRCAVAIHLLRTCGRWSLEPLGLCHRLAGEDLLLAQRDIKGYKSSLQNYGAGQQNHTVATRTVREAQDIQVAKELLGHRSITTTLGYRQIAKDVLRERAKRLRATGAQSKDNVALL